jgi:hypothetical protein
MQARQLTGRITVSGDAIAAHVAEERRWEQQLDALALTPHQRRKYFARARASRWYRRFVVPEYAALVQDMQRRLVG